jgi:hypothetical protein
MLRRRLDELTSIAGFSALDAVAICLAARLPVYCVVTFEYPGLVGLPIPV